jgi:hypothetical protein
LLAQPGHAELAPLEPSKRANIEQLMVTMNVAANMKAMSNAMMQSFLQNLREGRNNLTPEQVQEVVKTTSEVFAENYGSFHELMVHLYHKHFSATDIQQLRDFYDTDIGKKLIAVTPALTQESFEIGAQWGQVLAPMIQQRVKERLAARGIAL